MRKPHSSNATTTAATAAGPASPTGEAGSAATPSLTRVIAIDGPAGSGKSTVARQLARRLGFTLLDTGAIYRSLALRARQRGIAWDAEQDLAEVAGGLRLEFVLDGEINRVLVDGVDVSVAIRAAEISRGASLVSRFPAVRRALLEMQRDFARRGPVVAEGRDVSTVVFPAAALKVFLTASADERARRRHEELRRVDPALTLREVLQAEQQRDAADSGRSVAPLRPAAGALRVDTTEMSVDEVVAQIAALAADL